MTREGAVEVNAATGKKKRISNRIRDADLTRKEAAPQQPEQAAQPIPGGAAPAPAADAPPGRKSSKCNKNLTRSFPT